MRVQHGDAAAITAVKEDFFKEEKLMKMKKRFLGILLTLALILGLMPGMSLTAYADGTTYNPASSYTGFGDLITSDTEVTISEVPGKTWYVIACDASTVTLLSKESFGYQKFNSSTSKGNNYENLQTLKYHSD